MSPTGLPDTTVGGGINDLTAGLNGLTRDGVPNVWTVGSAAFTLASDAASRTH